MDLNRPKLKQLAISKIPIFKNIPHAGQEQLALLLVLCEFKKGQSIIVSDRPGREIMFIADGAVDVKRSNLEGREVIVSRLGLGDFFGEISILTESNRTADVTAAEDCMLLSLGKSIKFNDITELGRPPANLVYRA